MRRPRIAIALGDPAGIGPEIALKAALDERVTKLCDPLLVGGRHALETHARLCGLAPKIVSLENASEMSGDGGAIRLLDLDRGLRRPASVGREAVVGAKGVALSDLDPNGQVHVQGENWTAVLAEGAAPIRKGGKVIVKSVQGLTLEVEPAEGGAPRPQA